MGSSILPIFSATIELGSNTVDMTLSFKCNKNLTVTVEGGSIGTNTGSGNDYVYAITGATGSLKITFTNGLTSNARLDNINFRDGGEAAYDAHENVDVRGRLIAQQIERLFVELEDSVSAMEHATADGKEALSNRIAALSKVLNELWDSNILTEGDKDRLANKNQ